LVAVQPIIPLRDGASIPDALSVGLTLNVTPVDNKPQSKGKSGPTLGGTEYRLMPLACRLIVRTKL